jgi:hypothetical protein
MDKSASLLKGILEGLTAPLNAEFLCPASVENGHPQSPARELLSCEHRLGLAS